MIYPDNFETKIGFDKIRELISAKCLSSLGIEKTDEMAFSTNFEHIQNLLSQTEEFVRILQEEDEFPANYFFDVRPALKGIRIEGTWLDENALFDLRRSLQTIKDIVSFLQKEDDENTSYPHLQDLAGDVLVFPQLISKTDAILDKFGRIKDNASPELNRIRKEIAQTTSGISRSLNAILRSAQTEGLVEKDVTPTMRDGRLVIPVAPAFKRKLKGIVHDESASGKTVFIEPSEVVEANNRIRELESEERREIVKILIAFTNEVRPLVPDIVQSYDFLAWIDFIRAKARFALDINAIKPVIENTQQIGWDKAKHPLLYLSHKKQNKTVVPLDIWLDHTNRLLIISGPNAGGKSVCLKTVGLLQYMVQCGLLIPLAESSKVGIFDKVFIDIGDEQSIENDLSTYSSHLTNMKHFVRNCDGKTILLIDEFGGGTEPQIGGAIAESLLKRFNQKGAFGVITTHYQNLKHFANENKGVVNGAMLYDRHLMQPLFSLSIGNPGSSFAIEIARKIGLPEDVIADASEIVGSDYINMDKYLQDIVRDKRYWEQKRQSVRQKEKRLEELTQTYETDLQDVVKQRKEIIRKAKEEAQSLVSEANAKIENTIRSIKEAQAEKEKTKDIRSDLAKFRERLAQESDLQDEKIARKMQKLQNRDKNKQKKAKPSKEAQMPETISVGNDVRIKGQISVGQVMDIQGRNAIVAFGMIKSTVKLDTLERVSKNQQKRDNVYAKNTFVSDQTHERIYEKKLNFKQDIDVRGMRGDEALQAVMYFVDDAIQIGVSRVRILHGTGTGILRQLIRDYLRGVNGVCNYQDEHVQFGGAGITVVDLE
ncbi:DNA mismatch repair protein MutS2 [Dysgonomonas sp. PH5-45]|uniref:endonuclease MutS2 n=1 Tax=unclassified Dysgonomonas TaxID=2630389 RepID=UPI0024765DBD|nr:MULTISPECIES: Smr/MutS family protein [unclassified Dysgonomonas]MDH6353920.1 DNA mismatch repair protein MutS2 [Dysgonomonas sp. PH5-45]MDH6386822.1 DNA mismatch repair protein MutS2 [Dysgonomonas sp. PH5-37]